MEIQNAERSTLQPAENERQRLPGESRTGGQHGETPGEAGACEHLVTPVSELPGKAWTIS